MTHYYNATKDGELWCELRNSNDAEQFGATEVEPNHVHYYIDNPEACTARLHEIFTELGLAPRFEFDDDEAIDEYVASIEPDEFTEHSRQLIASLSLGLKLYAALRKQGGVQFEVLL